MPFISPRDRQTLEQRFRKELKRMVTLKLFTQTASQLTIQGRECPTCPQTRQILEELASLSPILGLEAIYFHVKRRKPKKAVWSASRPSSWVKVGPATT